MKIIEKEGLVTVTKTVVDRKTGKNEKTEKVDKIKIRPFVTDTSTVGIQYKTLINTGDFSNVSVSVFISVPCYLEETVNVFRQVEKLGTELMLEQIGKVKTDA